jgi:hypothetical protein
LATLFLNFYCTSVEESCPKIWAISVIVIILLIVSNRPIGEDSPYLVALIAAVTVPAIVAQLQGDQMSF